jgi:hypothetical protein
MRSEVTAPRGVGINSGTWRRDDGMAGTDLVTATRVMHRIAMVDTICTNDAHWNG